jgi:hypothetical protein
MNIKRLILRHAIAGGLAALAGWAGAELLPDRTGHWFSVALTCGLVGAALGAALNVVAGVGLSHWRAQARRLVSGLIAGAIAGAFGGTLGNISVHALHWHRAIGWTLMGIGLGLVEGLYERSPAQLRTGLIGGAAGGVIGGLLFHPVYALLSLVSNALGRATAFVILGVCIGTLIGAAKLVFARAWLTVVVGDRPGRQLLLAGPAAILERTHRAALALSARGDTAVDLEHARILRLEDGRFNLEDNHSRHGTSVNRKRVLGRVVLSDGDVIEIGASSIQFRDRGRHGVPKATDPPPPSFPPPAPATPVAAAPKTAPTPTTATTTPTATATTALQAGTAAPPGPSKAIAGGATQCPSCKRVVAGGARYCLYCDLSF